MYEITETMKKILKARREQRRSTSARLAQMSVEERLSRVSPEAQQYYSLLTNEFQFIGKQGEQELFEMDLVKRAWKRENPNDLYSAWLLLSRCK